MHVGGHFDRETDDPHERADDGESVQAFARGSRDGHQRGQGRDGNPQSLDRPNVEEAQEVRLDLVEAIILASLADATEEERAKTDGPDDDQHPNEDRAPIQRDAVAGIVERSTHHRDVGEAARKIEKLLGLVQVGRDKGQPLDEEGQSHCKHQDGDAAKPGAALTSRQRNEITDQDQGRE